MRRRRDLFLEQLHLRVLADVDERARDEPVAGCARAPANDDGVFQDDAARDMHEHPQRGERTGGLRQLVVRGQRSATFGHGSDHGDEIGMLGQAVGERIDHHAGRRGFRAERPRDDAVVGDLDERGRAFRDNRRNLRRVAGLQVWLDLVELRRA